MPRSNNTASPLSMQPRDIFGPVATLLGLMIASVGFLRTASLSVALLQTLTDLILLISICFVITAGSASLFSFTGRMRYWRFALFFYLISWSAFGIGVILMFLSVAYGNAVFLFLSKYGLSLADLFITVVFVLTVSLSLNTVLRSEERFRKNLAKVSGPVGEAMKSNQEPETLEAPGARIDTDDLSMAFIKLFIDMEVAIRDMFEKRLKSSSDAKYSVRRMGELMRSNGLINNDQFAMIKFLNELRNRLIHGYSVPKSHILQGIKLANVLLPELKKLQTQKNTSV